MKKFSIINPWNTFYEHLKLTFGLNSNLKVKTCPNHNPIVTNIPTPIQKQPTFRDLKSCQWSHQRSLLYQSWLRSTSSKTASKSWPKWKETATFLISTKAIQIAFKPLLSKRTESRPCGKETSLKFYFHFQDSRFRWRLEVSAKNKSPKYTNQPHLRPLDIWSILETSRAWFLAWEASSSHTLSNMHMFDCFLISNQQSTSPNNSKGSGMSY